MQISVYLHQDILSVLLCFGTLDEVVNKILEAGSQSLVDIYDKPAAPDRAGAGRYNITITDQEYLSIYNVTPPNSSKISIRRLLYWFVNNEIYEELGWTITNQYVDKKREKAKKKYNLILSELQRLAMLNENFYEITEQFKHMENLL